jgi:hypothetical protein
MRNPRQFSATPIMVCHFAVQRLQTYFTYSGATFPLTDREKIVISYIFHIFPVSALTYQTCDYSYKNKTQFSKSSQNCPFKLLKCKPYSAKNLLRWLNILETRELDGQICKCVILPAAGNEYNNKRVVIMQSWCEAKKGWKLRGHRWQGGPFLHHLETHSRPRLILMRCGGGRSLNIHVYNKSYVSFSKKWKWFQT